MAIANPEIPRIQTILVSSMLLLDTENMSVPLLVYLIYKLK